MKTRRPRSGSIRKIWAFTSVGIGAVVIVSACLNSPTPASPELLATLTQCPRGETRGVLSSYSLQCVRELFHNTINLIEPSDAYRSPLFEIHTPADAQQMVATYRALTASHRLGDPRLTLSLHIDSIGVNRGATTDDLDIDGTHVFVGVTDSSDRARYYWEWKGWWYTLEGPAVADEGRTPLLMIVRGLLVDPAT